MTALAISRFVAAVLLAAVCGLASAAPGAIRDCLAGICLDDSHASQKTVVKRLGQGVRVHRADDVGESNCYWSDASGVAAEFTYAGKEEAVPEGRIRGLTLTKVNLCPSSSGPKRVRIGDRLGGVAIGATEAEVLAGRGQPARIDDTVERERNDPSIANTRYSAKFGERVYVYGKPDELEVTFVFFKAGHVYTVWTTKGE